jgi:hypothetical protein
LERKERRNTHEEPRGEREHLMSRKKERRRREETLT